MHSKYKKISLIAYVLLIISCGNNSNLTNKSIIKEIKRNTFEFDIDISLNSDSNNSYSKVVESKEKDINPKKNETVAPKNLENKNLKKNTEVNSNNSDEKIKGRKILDKVLNTIKNANAYEVVVKKEEYGLENGKQTSAKILLWAKSPNEVLIELENKENPSSQGIRIKYKTGDTKIKVRPSGLVSFITPTLDMTDERVLGPNKYSPAKSDVFALTNRFLEKIYEAKLTGKTTIDKENIFILEITSTNENSLDPKISYEKIGFNPKDFTIKFWEAYTDGREEPFVKMEMEKFILLDSISDKKMKL